MQEILSRIKYIPELQPPYDISRKVMRSILFFRLRIPLLCTSLLFIIALILCQRIYINLIETDAHLILKIIIDDFELSWGYLSESWDGLLEIFSMGEARLLTANIGIIFAMGTYMYAVYHTNKKLLFNH